MVCILSTSLAQLTINTVFSLGGFLSYKSLSTVSWITVPKVSPALDQRGQTSGTRGCHNFGGQWQTGGEIRS